MQIKRFESKNNPFRVKKGGGVNKSFQIFRHNKLVSTTQSEGILKASRTESKLKSFHFSNAREKSPHIK